MTAKEPDLQVEEVVKITQTSQGSTSKLIEQEGEALFGPLSKPQKMVLNDLTALYYALLGPQALVETTGNISRPLYPIATKKR